MPQYTPIKPLENNSGDNQPKQNNILSGHESLPHVPPTNKVDQPKQEDWKQYFYLNFGYIDDYLYDKLIEYISPLQQQLSEADRINYEKEEILQGWINGHRNLEQQLSEKDKELSAMTDDRNCLLQANGDLLNERNSLSDSLAVALDLLEESNDDGRGTLGTKV